jgi:hypothetical protein
MAIKDREQLLEILKKNKHRKLTGWTEVRPGSDTAAAFHSAGYTHESVGMDPLNPDGEIADVVITTDPLDHRATFLYEATNVHQLMDNSVSIQIPVNNKGFKRNPSQK